MIHCDLCRAIPTGKFDISCGQLNKDLEITLAMKVRDLMTYPIVTMEPDATVFEAIQVMVRENKGSVLVAWNGLLKEIMGIITTSGMFRRVFAKGLDPSKVKISEIMTPAPLVTIGSKESVGMAAQLMMSHNIRRLPVVEHGALVGIITSKDLLKCVSLLECGLGD